ncbi:unnamed protein product [Amoebophrya sp. A120]|nr:unnamed protein product [Amoebophrya sp. A120]|eukprot:GSA120T00018783001.1
MGRPGIPARPRRTKQRRQLSHRGTRCVGIGGRRPPGFAVVVLQVPTPPPDS